LLAPIGVRTARRFTVCFLHSAAHSDFELALNNGRLMLPAQMRGNVPLPSGKVAPILALTSGFAGHLCRDGWRDGAFFVGVK
jgi:hypothetical protein